MEIFGDAKTEAKVKNLKIYVHLSSEDWRKWENTFEMTKALFFFLIFPRFLEKIDFCGSRRFFFWVFVLI